MISADVKVNQEAVEEIIAERTREILQWAGMMLQEEESAFRSTIPVKTGFLKSTFTVKTFYNSSSSISSLWNATAYYANLRIGNKWREEQQLIRNRLREAGFKSR